MYEHFFRKIFVKRGFTLAEVLITLAVVGVVAALTLPTLMKNINDKVRKSRLTTIQRKFSQGLDKLKLLDEINNYSSTEEFVNALAKNMKIICISSSVQDCFHAKKIVYGNDKKEILVNTITTPDKLGLEDSTDQAWSNPVSFITGDGTAYIISLNTKCAIDDGDGRSDSSKCIAGIYDMNGANGPNQFGSILNTPGDIFPVNSAGFGAFKIKGVEIIGSSFIANKPLNCFDVQSDLDLPSCYYENDYWAGAVQSCKDAGGRLPTKEEAIYILRYLINDESCMSKSGAWKCENVTFDSDRLATLDLPVEANSGVLFNATSDDLLEGGTYVRCLVLHPSDNYASTVHHTCSRNYSRYRAICVK